MHLLVVVVVEVSHLHILAQILVKHSRKKQIADSSFKPAYLSYSAYAALIGPRRLEYYI